MDASLFIGPGITFALMGGAYLLAEGGRRKTLQDLVSRVERCELKHGAIVEHEARIEELERRVKTHKEDFHREIDRIERRMK